jgi:hypothetical protein
VLHLLATPVPDRYPLLDLERIRLLLYYLDPDTRAESGRAVALEALAARVDKGDVVAAVRRWTHNVADRSPTPELRFYGALSPFDVEEELARVSRLVEWLERSGEAEAMTPPLVEAASDALRARYAFGAAGVRGGYPAWTQRILAAPTVWAGPVLVLLSVAWIGGGWPWALGAVAWASVVAALVGVLVPSSFLLTFMPRLGAAVAVGLIAVSFNGEVWHLAMNSGPARAAVLSALLVAGTLAYLCLEVRNRGVRSWRWLGRALQILLVASAQAGTLVTAALLAVGPTMWQRAGEKAGVGAAPLGMDVSWSADPAIVLPWWGAALYAAMSLFLGVLLQLLWEDKALSERV